MAEVTVVFWRDIPAQVIVGRGRRGAKVQLPEVFEQSIDRAAMKAGMVGTDDYLEQWRKEVVGDREGDPQSLAEAEAERIVTQYDKDRLKELIANLGVA